MGEPDLIHALSALAQEVRLRVFRTLVGAGPQGMTPGALSAALAVSPTSLSFHLKELCHAGLATQERDGRHLIYRADLVRMDALLDALAAQCSSTVEPVEEPAEPALRRSTT